MNEIRARLDALPNAECKWKAQGRAILDVRDRPIAEVTAGIACRVVAGFIVSAPEDIAHLLAEVERLQAEAAAMRAALHPLAALYHTRLDDLNDDAPLYQHCDGLITVGDVRRAKDALADDVGRKMLAEAAAMREALEAVEWIFRTGTGYCPWCGKPFKSGHAEDCQRQLALSADAGRGLKGSFDGRESI